LSKPDKSRVEGLVTLNPVALLLAVMLGSVPPPPKFKLKDSADIKYIEMDKNHIARAVKEMIVTIGKSNKDLIDRDPTPEAWHSSKS